MKTLKALWHSFGTANLINTFTINIIARNERNVETRGVRGVFLSWRSWREIITMKEFMPSKVELFNVISAPLYRNTCLYNRMVFYKIRLKTN